jgi:hypothetical protein
MAEMHRSIQDSLQRPVAIKLLLSDLMAMHKHAINLKKNLLSLSELTMPTSFM